MKNFIFCKENRFFKCFMELVIWLHHGIKLKSYVQLFN
jgi:protein TonB